MGRVGWSPHECSLTFVALLTRRSPVIVSPIRRHNGGAMESPGTRLRHLEMFLVLSLLLHCRETFIWDGQTILHSEEQFQRQEGM
jgi:hypothetical protein